jgi:GTP cyclohydrolase I
MRNSSDLSWVIAQMLNVLDPAPNREGIRETPDRAAKAWLEWTEGYEQDPDEMCKTFEDGAEGYTGLVIVHNIDMRSICEHHLAPITGIAHVGYIPGNGRVIGISKLARITNAYARRLQVQERVTTQIADCLERNLKPLGVGVLIRAEHGCMSSRGVRLHGSTTTTSAMRGCLMDEPAARSEFLHLCAQAEK